MLCSVSWIRLSYFVDTGIWICCRLWSTVISKLSESVICLMFLLELSSGDSTALSVRSEESISTFLYILYSLLYLSRHTGIIIHICLHRMRFCIIKNKRFQTFEQKGTFTFCKLENFSCFHWVLFFSLAFLTLVKMLRILQACGSLWHFF